MTLWCAHCRKHDAREQFRVRRRPEGCRTKCNWSTGSPASSTSIGGRITALPEPVIVFHEGAEWLQTFGSGY